MIAPFLDQFIGTAVEKKIRSNRPPLELEPIGNRSNCCTISATTLPDLPISQTDLLPGLPSDVAAVQA
jgi:hypothetical protein